MKFVHKFIDALFSFDKFLLKKIFQPCSEWTQRSFCVNCFRMAEVSFLLTAFCAYYISSYDLVVTAAVSAVLVPFVLMGRYCERLLNDSLATKKNYLEIVFLPGRIILLINVAWFHSMDVVFYLAGVYFLCCTPLPRIPRRKLVPTFA